MCLLKCRIDDYGNVDGDRELSRPWTSFTQFTILIGKPNGDIWSGTRVSKVQTTSRPDDLWPVVWSNISKALNKTKNNIALLKSRRSTLMDTDQARKVAGMASDISQEQAGGHRKGTNKGTYISFCDIDGLCATTKKVPTIKWSCRQPQKVLDVIPRLHGCAGQASDAVSAYTTDLVNRLNQTRRIQ